MNYFLIFLMACLVSCQSHVYVVRHAEKATAMGNNTDVPLTAEGQARAIALRDSLAAKKLVAVFSSNTIRTRSTAQPAADYFHLPVTIYRNPPDSSLYNLIRKKKGNVLVVGHSNTVDDIVNALCGQKVIPSDLEDRAYDNLFELKRKGKKFYFNPKRYGATAH